MVFGTFAQSSELLQLIESHGWTLYDVSVFPKSCPNWEELDGHSPATALQIGKNYLFVPVRTRGKTLRQMYAVTQGLGPVVLIEQPEDHHWKALALGILANVAFFTRLMMGPEDVCLTTPISSQLQKPDLVVVQYHDLLQTFQRHFFVITPEQFQTSLRKGRFERPKTKRRHS